VIRGVARRFGVRYQRRWGQNFFADRRQLDRIVEALEIEWFFNIQLVGDTVIEVNPRISTVIYQEDLNLPYLGVKRALGELGDDELESLRARLRPGRTALRYFDQLEWDAEA